MLVQAAYERATGNRWSQADSEAYERSRLVTMAAEMIVSTLEAVANRTPAKINSFRYSPRLVQATARRKSR